MEISLAGLSYSLSSKAVDALLRLYYNKEGIAKDYGKSSFDKKTLGDLVDKNLVLMDVATDESVISLTDQGLSICGAVMFNRINDKKTLFKQEIQELPERAIACLVNRVMWRDIVGKETGAVDEVIKPYELDESMWYEQVLLKDPRMENLLERFYDTLENLGFIRNIDEQRWCSPEVENFLREEYRDIMGLSWTEEDSLKYYYFFYVYAHDQKNLIDFTGDGEKYRSMFFGEGSAPPDYWFSSNRSDPHELLSSLGVSEQRVMGFLDSMREKEIVGERYYPLSSFSFFSDNDKIFVIRDIKAYIDFISKSFLVPVVDSLLG